MTRYRQTLFVLLLTLFSGAVFAQNNTNSPYTRYGYGQLFEQGSANSKAMGGVAYGLRDKSHANFANPASYTAVDSLTFIFDGGVSLQNTNFSDGAVKRNAKNSSFDYITMLFRLSPRMAMGIGLLPYSNVGYNLSNTQTNTTYPENSATITHTGEGGLHQVYGGLGYKLFGNLSIGANFSYLWGDITHTRAVTFPSNTSAFPETRILNTAIKSYKLDFGAQYTQRLGKKHLATVGVVFSPGHNLGNDSYVQTQLGNSSTGATVYEKDTVMTTGIPTTLGLGVAYIYDNRLTVGADVTMQQWSNTTFMNKKDALCDRLKVGVGAEYIPNQQGRSYLSHVKYRVGAYYAKPYYKIDGVRAATEYGVSAGLGLPLPRNRSLLSISAQYARMQGSENRFLNENILRVCVGVTFNERWFWKRKVD